MQELLVTAGIALTAAAIAGGGLKAFHIDVPGLTVPRQVALGGFGIALFALGWFGPGNDGPANGPTPTASPTSATTATTLDLIPELSAHVWRFPGGSASLLEVERYSYRAGVTHVEDLPPAGESLVAFSFDLASVSADAMERAELDLATTDVVGDPFGEIGPLNVEEVSLGDLGQVLVASPIQLLGELSAPTPSTLDVTDAVRGALERGATRFQVRLSFAGVDLPDIDAALAASDAYAEWDGGPVLTVTLSR